MIKTKIRKCSKLEDSNAPLTEKLYKSFLGRILLKLITLPWVSKLAALYLNSHLSVVLIDRFVEKNHIDLEKFEETEYDSFNAFFTRHAKKIYILHDENPYALISPCDAKLTCYRINQESIFTVKSCDYKLSELVGNKELAEEYSNGICLVFRLCVEDYHRYCFIDDGLRIHGKKIKGVLHTVQPIAVLNEKVFVRNSREVTILDTDHFSKVVQIEVGALLVGKISNDETAREFKKGQEKGYFEFGGSTVILLLKNGVVDIDDDIIINSNNGMETTVRYGEKIGIKTQKK